MKTYTELKQDLHEVPEIHHFEFPSDKHAKQFEYDVSNAGIAAGYRAGNKVQVSVFGGSNRRTVANHLSHHMNSNKGQKITPKSSGVVKPKSKPVKESVELDETMLSSSGGVAGMHQNITPTDNLPEIGGREADRIKVNKKKKNETFAGCRVFALNSEEYNNCLRGRNKFERWSRKLNMEELNNQSIRTYAHQNPGQPIIIKDSTTGIMAYLIPPKR